MLVTMDMCSSTEDSDYTSEVMCVGWNPEIAMLQGKVDEVAAQLIQYQSQSAVSMPADIAALDVESFLERMYTFQR